jgi:hypothetical protein
VSGVRRRAIWDFGLRIADLKARSQELEFRREESGKEYWNDGAPVKWPCGIEPQCDASHLRGRGQRDKDSLRPRLQAGG